MVDNDVGIITVRNSSTRLPAKATKKITKQESSIDIVIERAKKMNIPIILATSIDQTDNIFEKIAKSHDIEIFRGSLKNKMKRWYDCFSHFKLDNAVLVDGDDIAFNYEIGIRSLNQLKSSKVDMIKNAENIVCGFFTYTFSKKAIMKLHEIASLDTQDTDVPTKFIEKAKLNSEVIHLEEYEKNKDVRLTLDYEDDLIFFRKLYQNVGILSSGKEIINFLEQNKKITEINFFRQKEYLENQEKFNKKVIL